MLIWFIIFCEVGFWVVLALGLFVRFILKLNVLSKFILLCVPVLDLFLLVATAMDLNNGASAEFAHGLAAVYLGFTIVYGSRVISWTDSYVSYKFYSGENPRKLIYGWSYAKYELFEWFQGLLACTIAVILLSIAILYIDNSDKTEALVQ